jgi:glucokinase
MAVGSGSPGYVIGVDVGGTKVLAVALGHGATAIRASSEHATRTGPAVLDVVERCIGEVRAAADPALGPLLGIGVGLPGLVGRDGVLYLGPHLPGAGGLAVGPVLAARHGVPVVVDNDGNCAAWAEQLAGVGAADGQTPAVDDLLFIGLGTGISCGMVVGGRRVRGVHGFAGEPGHMTLVPDGPACACGRRGCWEALASGTALADQAREAAATGALDDLLGRLGVDAGALRGEHVTEGLRTGDPGAVTVAEAFCRWVALGLVNLVHLLDPEVVALGGSVVDDADLWLPRIRRQADALLLGGALRRRTRIVGARAGRNAGAVGAALLAQEATPPAEMVTDRRDPDV